MHIFDEYTVIFTMNDLNYKEIGKVAYKKANHLENGDPSLTIGNFTIDELKVILLTIDGLGRSFKIKALDELIERISDEARDACLPPI